MVVNVNVVKFWVVIGCYNGGVTFSLFEYLDASSKSSASLRPLKKFYLAAHAGPVRTVAFNETAKVCVSGGADETIRFFDLVKFETDGVIAIGNQGPASVEFVSLKGDINANLGRQRTGYLQSCTVDGDVCLWNTRSKSIVHQTKYKPRNSQRKIMKKRSPVADLCVHPKDASISAVTYLDGSVQIWALDDKYSKSVLWEPDRSVDGSFNRVICCKWSCGGDVCILQSPRSILVVQIASGEVLTINALSTGDKYTTLATRQDQMFLGTSSGKVYIYNLTSLSLNADTLPGVMDNDQDTHIFADLWIELSPPDAKKIKSMDVIEVGMDAILVTIDIDGYMRFWRIGESEKECALIHSETISMVPTSLRLKQIPVEIQCESGSV